MRTRHTATPWTKLQIRTHTLPFLSSLHALFYMCLFAFICNCSAHMYSFILCKAYYSAWRICQSHRQKDTSTPRCWCMRDGRGCWDSGRTAPSVAGCWPSCSVSCSWRTVASSSVPESPLPPPRTSWGPRQQAGQVGLEAVPGRWRSWCRGIHQHESPEGEQRGAGAGVGAGRDFLTDTPARQQGRRGGWHSLRLWGIRDNRRNPGRLLQS